MSLVACPAGFAVTLVAGQKLEPLVREILCIVLCLFGTKLGLQAREKAFLNFVTQTPNITELAVTEDCSSEYSPTKQEAIF